MSPEDSEIVFTKIKNDERRRMWPEVMEESGEGTLMEVFLPAECSRPNADRLTPANITSSSSVQGAASLQT